MKFPFMGKQLFSCKITPSKLKVFIEVLGCQMNVNDAELISGILCKPDTNFTRTDLVDEANIALLMTCSIRGSAEEKAWNRLDFFNSLRTKYRDRLKVIGVLGCMAERLKLDVFERKKYINLICGPDSYRSLPSLLRTVINDGKKAVDVDLSMHETYEEELVESIRNPLSKVAYVSIMRGCNNMCTFCIVPFTRGRERSRSPESIEKEIQALSQTGVKEVTLLGQNVNSYNYVGVDDEEYLSKYVEADGDEYLSKRSKDPEGLYSHGFKPLYKPRIQGTRFTRLLSTLSVKFPDMRFRFTSPHPRDFPDELLDLIASRSNVARHIHLPLQSGSSAVLERMRRGYTKEAYLNLVQKIRQRIPGIGISTDVIAGFCGETDEDHRETLQVFDAVAYDMAYMYSYSMREKTAAFRRYNDDVPECIKQKRLEEIIKTFKRRNIERLDTYLGKETVILVEGDSKRSPEHYSGRSSENHIVTIPKATGISIGDFVKIEIVGRKGSTLVGKTAELTAGLWRL